MTIYDDPNREAVGMPPIWTDTEAAPKSTTSPSPTSFDPGEHTVAEVEDYLAKHPDQEDAVLAAEAKGKNRATLTGS